MRDQVVRAQNGDAEAFEQLVRHYESKVRRLAWRMCYNPEVSQDIAQEIFLQVWRKLPQLREPDLFVPWLHRVAVTTGMRLLSNDKSVYTTGDHLAIGGKSPGPEDIAIANESVRMVREEIAMLPPAYRVALSFYLEGLTYQEISGLLGVPPRTIETRLRRARQRLSERLNPTEGR